jgi:hypothetical protein
MWSQIVFFPRNGTYLESLVEGYLDNSGIHVTSVSDMDGNVLVLSLKEQQDAKECLYDSLVNYTRR